MEVVNVFGLAVEHDVDDPPGYQGGGERLGPLLGASMLGMTLYELPPGNRICPYHYEYGNEEWAIVVSGRPTLRTPDGDRELEPGDVVCFPEGPEGAHSVGMTLYELPPGNRICPYHYEYGNEEWVIVVSGRPMLRTPEGERELEPGDVVCFPEGPEGAHSVGSAGDETVRVIMLSTKQRPDVSIYPDSDKFGVYPVNLDDMRIFRRRDAVDYFDGEL